MGLSIVILVVIIIFLMKKSTQKKYEMVTEKATEKPITNKTTSELSNTEKTSMYFDVRMDLLLREKFGKELVRWEYLENMSLKYRKKENEVRVYLKNGDTETVSVFTESVWGKRFLEEEKPEPKKPVLSPAQLWLLKHGAAIENSVQNAIASNNGVEITYPLSEDANGLKKEIVELLKKNTAYTVSFCEDNLIINFQAFCVPEL